MKIEIKKHNDLYFADLLDLPGTPPIGTGLTPEMALGCLFIRLLADKAGPDTLWIDFIKKDELIINGEVWKDYHTGAGNT